MRLPVTPVVLMDGQRFGHLAVLGRDNAKHGGQAYWVCRCDCGELCSVNGSSLRRGLTKSCGCQFRTQALGSGNRTHGKTGTPEYKTWLSMRARCYYKKAGSYSRYGAKGIRVCKRWRHDFAAFLEDMGPKPTPKHQIERIDQRGNYTTTNCRWATAKEQAVNRKRTRLVTRSGFTLCIKDWCIKLGINRKTVVSRMRAGATPEQAIGFV